jgi:catechol 2,3-dioxygenase-like lactoylglutathione lyase family enzyme
MRASGVRGDASGSAKESNVDLKLEVVLIPVFDVDRAKEFYSKLGWRLDADFPFDNSLRRAAAAHGGHEKRIGQADEKWADWYAAFMVAEQAGRELPT